MKKIGIVSCYFIHNYGSMLQAYATQKILDKLQVENETINVVGFLGEFRKAQYSYILKSGITSEIFKDRMGKAKNLIVKKILRNKYTSNMKKRDMKFSEFADSCIRKSEVYHSLSDLADKCAVNYDTVLIGSDQLWLPANIAANYYTLNFVPKDVNTIAYATSFGISSLPTDIANSAKKFLPRIKHISVRERTGQKLIMNLTGRSVPVVCDPTLLCTGEEWMDIQSKEALIKEPYIFCYFIGQETVHRTFAERLKEEKGLRIVALTHVDHYVKCDEGYADDTPYDIGPGEFLNLIRNAEYICTDSFHCTVFSILYKKEFFEFKRYTRKTNMSTNSRLDTLFDLLDIQGRMLDGDEDIKECLEKKIDYERVHRNLANVRIESYNYLKKALADQDSTDLK